MESGQNRAGPQNRRTYNFSCLLNELKSSTCAIKVVCITQTFVLDPERPTATAIFGMDSQSSLGNFMSYLKQVLFYRSAAVHMCKVTKVGDMMSRWFRRNKRKNEMTTIGKNILSDPTSDGNFSTTDNNDPTERPTSPAYSYEEFDDRVNNHVCSDQSLTQTCPTCGGTGKLTKGRAHLIPVRIITISVCLQVSQYFCVTK